ncbi:uncharacterized protein LOC135500445 [Lineus longissimus]|uniref:uncharacterized protein LOC135500445 n=1 Tax=Lineus longissimus TaxID=88925 RepID=UPI002B4E1B62
MDDVFDEDRDDIEISRREWSNLKENRVKEGYKKGLAAGEERKLQEGFDDGYKTSVNQAYQLARMRGILCAVLVKLHENDPTASSEDTQLTTKLVEEISDIEKDLLQHIQVPAADETGLPGPSSAGLPRCGGDDGKPCACTPSEDSKPIDRKGTDNKNHGEPAVTPCDKNLNHDSFAPSSGAFPEFSRKINQVMPEVVTLLTKMGFSSDFIATL